MKCYCKKKSCGENALRITWSSLSMGSFDKNRCLSVAEFQVHTYHFDFVKDAVFLLSTLY